MRYEPVLTIHCDGKDCRATIDVGLTTTAGGYDERAVDDDLERNGWSTDGGDFCEECKERRDGKD
jgi:hypothetical protein